MTIATVVKMIRVSDSPELPICPYQINWLKLLFSERSAANGCFGRGHV